MPGSATEDVDTLASALLEKFRLGSPNASACSVRPAGGHSGYTYYVRLEVGDEHERLVVRIAPPGARQIGPADVVRQGRIMSALAQLGRPVPHVRMTSEEAGDLGGRAFVVMTEMRGSSLAQAIEHAPPTKLVRAAALELEQIQSVPVEATGIADEEPRSLRAEVERWRLLRERSPQEGLEAAAGLEARLGAALPTEEAPVLVHGDFHLANLLFHQGRVAAVIDWEIAHLGQPMLDQAALCMAGIRRRFPGPNPGGEAGFELSELIEICGIRSVDFPWFLALTCLKYAAILAYNLGLHRRGRRIDPVYEELVATIPGLLDTGVGLLS